MDSRKIMLLAGALVVAAITAFMARSLIAGSPSPVAGAVVAPPVDGPQVLVATRALPVGTILDATALKFQPWPKELVDGAYYLKDATNVQSLVGTVVRNPITAGQPVIGALHGPSHYWYCPHCMNWLYTEPDGMDWFVNVRATLLDDPYWFSPFVETKTSEKLPWVTIPARYSYPEWPPNDVFEGIAKDYAAQFG